MNTSFFFYKDKIQDPKGNPAIIYQGFNINEVLDYAYSSYYDETEEDESLRTKSTLFVRLKHKAKETVQKPKFNKSNQLIRTDLIQEDVHINHTITDSKSIWMFFLLIGYEEKAKELLDSEMLKLNIRKADNTVTV
jgi:hypothetical protein